MTPAPSGPRRVVFVNRFYWPDHSATAQILTDLATGLAAQGWEVTVIASRLRYEGGETLAARETHAGVAIHRVATTRFGRDALAGRAIDYLSFYPTAMIAAFWALRRGGILVAKTDPPLLQIPLSLVAWLRGARQINWMQDVFPEVAAASGMEFLAGWPGRALTGLRTRSIRGSAATVAIGARMKEARDAQREHDADLKEGQHHEDPRRSAHAAGREPKDEEGPQDEERPPGDGDAELGAEHR